MIKRNSIMDTFEPKVHKVKCVQPYFNLIKTGFKRFEVRKDGRDYQEGEFLQLEEYNPETKQYTKSEPLIGRIVYKLSGGQFGIQKGYCVMDVDWNSALSKPLNPTIKH